MTIKELFDFITDLSITAENLDEYLERAMQISSQRSHTEITEKEKIDEEVNVLHSFYDLFGINVSVLCCYCRHRCCNHC